MYSKHNVAYDSKKQKQYKEANSRSNFIFSNDGNHMYSETTQKRDYDEKQGH